METRPEEAAKKFLLMGIQHWGQSSEERAAATRTYLKAAGFEEGQGSEAADWLRSVLVNLRRGKFEEEVEQLTAALSKARRETQ